MSSDASLLEISGLRTEFATDRGTVNAVDDVDLSIDPGETYGLVGESGAGKSVTGRSIMRLINSPGSIVGGEIQYKGEDLLAMEEDEVRSLRGPEIAMIFQDPMTALNPSYTIGTQIIDTILTHLDVGRTEARERAIELLGDVGIPDSDQRIDDYPHQLSGGMRQRALIAMALSCDPSLIIADEPTTALDVTIQAQILDLLQEIKAERGLTVLLITHDMGLIAEMCDRVGVLYAGEKVEEAPVEEIFAHPRHPYTVGLMKAIPRLDDPRDELETIPGTMPDLITTPSGCSYRDRCPHATEECSAEDPPFTPVDGSASHQSACIRVDEIDLEGELTLSERDGDLRERHPLGDPLVEADGLRKYFESESQSWLEKLLGDREYVHAVEDVSLTIRERETLGLVGESGCGKSTLGRLLTQLEEPDAGTVVYAGDDLTEMSRRQLRDARSEVQMIFQDPFSSLNPRRPVKDIIGRPLEIHDLVSSEDEKRDRVVELLHDVGLEESVLDRYPHEFSGGQKQRIGIARALAVEPDFIVADEPVSALDVSVQAKIINELRDLQDKYDVAYLFIAHDLNVVQHISDRVAVMYLGEIVEHGTVEEVFTPPYHPYTEVLLSSIPRPDPDTDDDRIVPEGEPPSAINPPSGCRFHTRCPHAMPECSSEQPTDVEVADDYTISCHLFDDEMMDAKEEKRESAVQNQKQLLED